MRVAFIIFKGYDSKKNYKILHKKGYIPLIPQNRKNIKNKNLLRKFNEKHNKIYKKRNIIENYHSWLKKFKKIKCLYEHKVNYYEGLLLLGLTIIVSRRINKES
jgi:transposase